jgi:hypothetical protein
LFPYRLIGIERGLPTPPLFFFAGAEYRFYLPGNFFIGKKLPSQYEKSGCF